MSFDLNESDMQRTVIALVYEARSTLPKYTRTPRKRGTKRRTGKQKIEPTNDRPSGHSEWKKSTRC